MKPHRPSGEGLTLGAICLAAGLLFVLPLGRLVWTAKSRGGNAFVEALSSASVRTAFLNSLDSAAFSALGALVVGTCLAGLIGLTVIRGKDVFVFLLLLPTMIPPHVTAVAWIRTLEPPSPVPGWVGLAPAIGTAHPLHSRGGVIFLLTIQHAPLVFLVVLAALRALPREMIEAARIAGTGPWRLLRRIVLPLLAPSLIAATGLAFVSALGNFGIPASLGVPDRYVTMPVLIWRRLVGFGPSVLVDVAVLSILLAGLAVAIVLLQGWLQRRVRTALIGSPQPPLRIALERGRPLWEEGLALFVAGTLILPLAAFVATSLAALVETSLVATYRVPSTFGTMTLGIYAEVLLRQDAAIRAFANSTLVASGAVLALAGLAAFASRFAEGAPATGRRIGGAVATFAEMSYAIPGPVISSACILVYLRPIPVVGIFFYNMLTLIFLAYLTAFFAIGLKPIAAATGQLDPALDDAARVSGAGLGRQMRRVHLPLVAPAAASPRRGWPVPSPPAGRG